MRWLDSGPIKFLNFTASLFTVSGAVGGGLLGRQLKGDDWGFAPAIVVGGFLGMAGMVLFFVTILLILRTFSRTCPVCKGTGTVGAFPYTMNLCPKCGGDGRIL